MSKFFKGQKVIVVKNPENQRRGITRIGTIVSIECRVLGYLNSPELIKESTPISVDLYNVQLIEQHDGSNPEYTKLLYNLNENDLLPYTETAEALYC